MEVVDSNYDTLNVAVCDDSALMRNLVSRIVNETPGMKVVGKAENGKALLDLVPTVKPDIIILDIEMPVMTGVEFLQERKKIKLDVPVIILSSIATKGAAVTMQCLELGASDFITKPGGSVSMDVVNVSETIVEKVASYGASYARRQGKRIPFADHFIKARKLQEAEKFVAKQKGDSSASAAAPAALEKPVFSAMKEVRQKEPAVITPLRDGGRIKIIALGISTGGPNALRDVFKMIDPHLQQPILVVQHMPAGFTKEFAQSLNKICPLTVEEAEDNVLIQKGHIYIAPGNYHIAVEERMGSYYLRTNQEDQRNGHRPSADVLFESVAKVFKNNALGVIMTGMGKDGAVQLAEMRKQGAWTLGQDEKSSIVYGMPRVAWELGGVQKQVSLMQMADEISSLARAHV